MPSSRFFVEAIAEATVVMIVLTAVTLPMMFMIHPDALGQIDVTVVSTLDVASRATSFMRLALARAAQSFKVQLGELDMALGALADSTISSIIRSTPPAIKARLPTLDNVSNFLIATGYWYARAMIQLDQGNQALSHFSLEFLYGAYNIPYAGYAASAGAAICTISQLCLDKASLYLIAFYQLGLAKAGLYWLALQLADQAMATIINDYVAHCLVGALIGNTALFLFCVIAIVARELSVLVVSIIRWIRR